MVIEQSGEARLRPSRVLQTRDSIPQQLIRTLIANIFHHPSTSAPGLLELQESVSAATIYLQAVRDVGSLAGQYMTQPEMLCAQRYLRALNMVCAGRRFFTTTRRSLGIGPSQTQAGDLAYIFKGAQVPFLFRQEQTGDCFKLVGETYIQD